MNPEIQRFFSASRMAPYLLPGETAAIGFARYQWNLQLAEALLPSLNYLEIGLRNALNRAISDIYGDDWLVLLPPKLGLSSNDVKDVADIKEHIQRNKGYPAQHDAILAQLGFGFWIAFFHKRYIPGLWSRGKNPLVVVFPNMGSMLRTRELIFARLRTIKILRNRIAHHEPIWKMTPPVSEVHHTCFEIIQGMSVAAADELTNIDRFPNVYAKAESK